MIFLFYHRRPCYLCFYRVSFTGSNITDYRLCDFVLIRLTRKQGRSSKRKSVLVFLFAVFQLSLYFFCVLQIFHHNPKQNIHIHRLSNMVIHACLQCGLPILGKSIRRHCKNGYFRFFPIFHLSDFFRCLVAV